MKVYLDNAATTAVDPEVLEEMIPYFCEVFGNPSSIHGFGRPMRAAIERSRKTIADLLNCSTGEIFFTSGGTEASNMAIKSAFKNLGAKHIITTAIEHHCVMYPVEEMAKTGEISMHHVDLQPSGEIDYNDLEKKLQNLEGPVFVTIMHANNEIGVLNDMDRISEICQQYNAIYHSDTVQTVGHVPIDLDKTNIHFITGSAHKFHGPKGVGFIYINGDVNIDPFLRGGSQERNQRAGTENVAGIVGMAKALELAVSHMDEECAYIEELKQYMHGQLVEKIPGVQFNTPSNGTPSLCRVLSVSFPEHPKNEMLLFNMDINGIAVSGGSACSSGANVGSHVLAALGKDEKRASVRFSFCKNNTKEEIDYVIGKLEEIFK